MTLQEYVKVNKLTLKKLQAKTGIDFRILHRYLKGHSRPSLANAHKIYLGTKKRVRLADWFKDKK